MARLRSKTGNQKHNDTKAEESSIKDHDKSHSVSESRPRTRSYAKTHPTNMSRDDLDSESPDNSMGSLAPSLTCDVARIFDTYQQQGSDIDGTSQILSLIDCNSMGSILDDYSEISDSTPRSKETPSSNDSVIIDLANMVDKFSVGSGIGYQSLVTEEFSTDSFFDSCVDGIKKPKQPYFIYRGDNNEKLTEGEEDPFGFFEAERQVKEFEMLLEKKRNSKISEDQKFDTESLCDEAELHAGSRFGPYRPRADPSACLAPRIIRSIAKSVSNSPEDLSVPGTPTKTNILSPRGSTKTVPAETSDHLGTRRSRRLSGRSNGDAPMTETSPNFKKSPRNIVSASITPSDTGCLAPRRSRRLSEKSTEGKSPSCKKSPSRTIMGIPSDPNELLSPKRQLSRNYYPRRLTKAQIKEREIRNEKTLHELAEHFREIDNFRFEEETVD